MSVLDDLQEILEAKHYGRYLAARCIFHDDSHASLMIYEDRYRCLACGKSGSTRGLLKLLKNPNTRLLSYSFDDDQPGQVSNPFTRWLKRQTLAQVLKSAWETLNQFPALGRYLTEERKIDEKTRRKLGLGYADDFYTFPILSSSGRIVGAFARARSGKSRYFIPEGQDPNLIFNPGGQEHNGRVFLTFGGIDAISLTMLGHHAISTTTGKRIAPEALDGFRTRIIIVPDYGEEEDAYKLASRLGWRGKVIVPPYPEGCKDCNDWFVRDRESMKKYFDQIGVNS